jgi:hypothetical protein
MSNFNGARLVEAAERAASGSGLCVRMCARARTCMYLRSAVYKWYALHKVNIVPRRSHCRDASGTWSGTTAPCLPAGPLRGGACGVAPRPGGLYLAGPPDGPAPPPRTGVRTCSPRATAELYCRTADDGDSCFMQDGHIQPEKTKVLNIRAPRRHDNDESLSRNRDVLLDVLLWGALGSGCRSACGESLGKQRIHPPLNDGVDAFPRQVLLDKLARRRGLPCPELRHL